MSATSKFTEKKGSVRPYSSAGIQDWPACFFVIGFLKDASLAAPAHAASAKMALERRSPGLSNRNPLARARLSRAEEGHSDAKRDFRGAGNSRDRDDAARFDQHSLVFDFHLALFAGQHKVRVNQSDQAQHDEQNSK